MRDQATQANDPERMQLWAGQSAALAQAKPVEDIIRDLWQGAQALLT
jgi:nitronate monooxygenase